jgi:hypothetical protein
MVQDGVGADFEANQRIAYAYLRIFKGAGPSSSTIVREHGDHPLRFLTIERAFTYLKRSKFLTRAQSNTFLDCLKKSMEIKAADNLRYWREVEEQYELISYSFLILALKFEFDSYVTEKLDQNSPMPRDLSQLDLDNTLEHIALRNFHPSTRQIELCKRLIRMGANTKKIRYSLRFRKLN